MNVPRLSCNDGFWLVMEFLQREIFNRIAMKLLKRRHGNYCRSCFWRPSLNEGTDLTTQIPAPPSPFSTGFAVLHHSSEASPSQLAHRVSAVLQLCWLYLVTGVFLTVEVYWAGLAKLCGPSLERDWKDAPTSSWLWKWAPGCKASGLVRRWGQIFLLGTGMKRRLF